MIRNRKLWEYPAAIILAALLSGAAASPRAVKLPPPTFEQLPGWLGFATVPANAKGMKYFWSPTSAGAQAVLFTTSWAKVPVGTRVTGLSANGKEQLTLVRSRGEHYGCERNEMHMASFQATRPIPEGPVWLVPPGEAGAVAAVAVQEQPISALPADLQSANRKQRGNARAWLVGPVTLVLEKSGGLDAALTAYMAGRPILKKSYAKYYMDGADKLPLDLFAKGEVGMPQPIGAFRLKPPAGPVIVFWLPGYEGNGYELLLAENGRGNIIEGDSMYFCAF